jgi:hypothetical protein
MVQNYIYFLENNQCSALYDTVVTRFLVFYECSILGKCAAVFSVSFLYSDYFINLVAFVVGRDFLTCDSSLKCSRHSVIYLFL